MQSLKKLPSDRKAYWLKKLKELETLVKTIEELKGPVPTELGSDDWILGLANWLDKTYSGTVKTTKNVTEPITNKLSEMQLKAANTLDTIYNGVADEVKKMPGVAGKAVTDFTGTSNWPYAIALGFVLYLAMPSLISKISR